MKTHNKTTLWKLKETIRLLFFSTELYDEFVEKTTDDDESVVPGETAGEQEKKDDCNGHDLCPNEG
jgi:hypothetical protein